jgi:hypothetical protein
MTHTTIGSHIAEVRSQGSTAGELRFYPEGSASREVPYMRKERPTADCIYPEEYASREVPYIYKDRLLGRYFNYLEGSASGEE